MNFLIVGCATVGSQLANRLSDQGHDVAVIDTVPSNFNSLSDSFHGYTVTGVPIDQDVLRGAGIEGCDALAAVTSDDNMNIMVCQMAREIFSVPRVLARIHDPRRGDVFSQLGLRTICPTNIAVDAFVSMLTHNERSQNIFIGSSTVAMDRITPSAKQVGMTIGELCLGNSSKGIFFGVLHDDGDVTLAHATSAKRIQQGDWLLYTRVVD